MSWIGKLKGAGLATDYIQAPYEVYKTYRQYKKLQSGRYRVNFNYSARSSNRFRRARKYTYKYRANRNANLSYYKRKRDRLNY